MTPEIRVDKGYVARSITVAVVCLIGAGILVLWAFQEGEPSPTWGFALVVSIIAACVSIFLSS